MKAEAEKASAKIDEAVGKLAKEMRERADKAKDKMDDTRKPEKRAVLLRRFELYSDAATHLEERLPRRDDQGSNRIKARQSEIGSDGEAAFDIAQS